MTTNNAFLAVFISTLAALCLAGCDGDTPNRAEGAANTAGQKIDRALDQTGQKLADAGARLRPRLQQAGEAISATAQRATAGMKDSVTDNSRLGASASNPNGSSLSITTGERTSVTGISPETRAVLSDTAITASIKADYLKDPDLSVLRIDVDTTGGVVTLNGVAENPAARQRAEKLAAAVKGVTQVRNYLTVKPG